MTWSMAAETSFIVTMEGSVTSRRLVFSRLKLK